MPARYRLLSFDTFAGEWYELEGEYALLESAEKAARERLDHLEETQPSSSSGGQAFGGIQDRVYILHPDGRRERYVGGLRVAR